MTTSTEIPPNYTQQATFAGGCFWCIQGPFDAQAGVTGVQVGYVGGDAQTASYYTVAGGKSEHREGLHFWYDPTRVTYEELVRIFFRQIDPTDPGGQFHDRGHQYTTAIYYHTLEQQQIAERIKQELAASGKFDKPIATEIVPFTTFFEAEDEHQAYYKKNPLRYMMYKKGSGRADYIKENWDEAEQ